MSIKSKIAVLKYSVSFCEPEYIKIILCYGIFEILSLENFLSVEKKMGSMKSQGTCACSRHLDWPIVNRVGLIHGPRGDNGAHDIKKLS